MRRKYTIPAITLATLFFTVTFHPSLVAQTNLEKAKSTPLQTIELYSRAVHEKAKWKSDKEILNHSLVVLEATARELSRKIEESKVRASTVSQNLEGLETELTDIDKGNQIIVDQIDKLQVATLDLARYAPPPLAEKISSSILTLNTQSESDDISLRIQSIASILINLNQFNKKYTDIRTLHTFEDETTQEIRILYAGLAQAFAINGNQSKAWILTPAPDEWSWQVAPEATQEIATAFKVLDKEIPPQLSQLPAVLTEIPNVAP